MSEDKQIIIGQRTVISFETQDRTYTLLVPSGAPIGELYDISCQLTGRILDLINQQQNVPEKEITPTEPTEEKEAVEEKI